MDQDVLGCDRHALMELEKKLELVRDRVRAVGRRYQTGFFLAGRGGVGKSHSVQDELDRLNVEYRRWNSHLTARGLFDRLQAFPDVVHFIEDVEQLVNNRQALGLLRSALWSVRKTASNSMERLVTWTIHGAAMEVVFTGGIIMTANRVLRDMPELNALKTRITWMELNVTEAEIAALMRKVASQGYREGKMSLSPAECAEVVEFVIEKSAGLNKSLDMRLAFNAFRDRVQAEDLEAACCWQDLVMTRIRGQVSEMGAVEHEGVRARNKKRELEIAREIANLPAEERFRTWQETTGKSRATLYRRLEELAERDSQGLGT